MNPLATKQNNRKKIIERRWKRKGIKGDAWNKKELFPLLKFNPSGDSQQLSGLGFTLALTPDLTVCFHSNWETTIYQTKERIVIGGLWCRWVAITSNSNFDIIYVEFSFWLIYITTSFAWNRLLYIFPKNLVKNVNKTGNWIRTI